jgi:hypothetical protein
MGATRSTDRRRSDGGDTRDQSFPSSPPTVQMCHLSDPTGSQLSGTRQNGYDGPGRLREWEHGPETVTALLEFWLRVRRST